MKTIPTDIITTPVPEFLSISGLGRSLAYDMMADGRLQSIKIGKRRLIVIDSYRRLIERQLATSGVAA